MAAAIGIEPPEIAVTGEKRTRLQTARDPFGREDALVTPYTAALHQETDARLVAGVNEHATAPVRTAGDRLDGMALDRDDRITVAAPLPIARGANRLQHQFAEHLRQGPLPDAQQRQAQPVDADVVVLPEPTGLAEVAMRALLGATRHRGAAHPPVAID